MCLSCLFVFLCSSKSLAAQAQLAAAARLLQQHRGHGLLGSARQHKTAATLQSAS